MMTAMVAAAQPSPALSWLTNSSVKLEQVIGDVDWADAAQGSNVLTTSQTYTRFNIVANDLGASFAWGTNLIFLSGDTRGSNVDYHAADPLSWSATTNGETGLLLNFFTNSDGSDVFVDPAGLDMSGDDVPQTGITLSNVIYLICNSGADTTDNGNKHALDYTVLVTFNPTNLTFQTNRTISVATNGGHFIFDSLHSFGTNVAMFGEGPYGQSDIYLAMTPASSFLSGRGTVYFTGLANGQPTWGTVETNAVPVVQDNPTNGPAWPHDSPTVAHMSVAYSTSLGLWLMTYDGGRNATNTDGIYFTCAAEPWGPWSTPQLIFNAARDHGFGEFMFNPDYSPPGPAGPTADPAKHDPTTTPGIVYSPDIIEPFTRISDSTAYIYYNMSTWNPYTVVKMRSAFAINPVIDPTSLVKLKKQFSFSWYAPPNIVYHVEYATHLHNAWTTITNLISSTNGTFTFTDKGTNNGGLGDTKFYRLQGSP